MTWQPIETAPRDGSRFLIWCNGQNDWPPRAYMAWVVNDVAAVCVDYPGGAGIALATLDGTHKAFVAWTPLPEPPATSGAA